MCTTIIADFTVILLGETMDRNYDWSKFTKSSLYGAPTPNDPTGKQVKNSLYWLTQAQKSVNPTIHYELMNSLSI